MQAAMRTKRLANAWRRKLATDRQDGREKLKKNKKWTEQGSDETRVKKKMARRSDGQGLSFESWLTRMGYSQSYDMIRHDKLRTGTTSGGT